MKLRNPLHLFRRKTTTITGAYTYSSLPTSPTSIRLITLQPSCEADPICCDIVQVSIDSDPKYEALSYTWGLDNPPESSEPSSYLITLSDQSFQVAPNLFLALRRLRHLDKCRRLWVDAICINQADEVEKCQQVQIMSKIYSKAERVVVWLGEEEPSDIHAFAMMSRFLRTFPTRDTCSSTKILNFTENEDEPGWLALGALLLRRWFTRLWVVQEVVMARQAVILCGSNIISWSNFAYVVCTIVDFGASSHFHDATPDGRAMMSVYLVRKMLLMKELIESGGKYGLLDALGLTRTLNSTDPRDKIYGILAFVQDEDWLVPDYQISTDELLQRVNMSFMTNKPVLNVLSLFDAKSYQNPCKITPWGPNWFDVELDREAFMAWGSLIEYGTSCKPQVTVSIDGGFLTLRGIRFDEVSQCGHTYKRFFQFTSLSSQDRTREKVVRAATYLASCQKVVLDAAHNLRPDQSSVEAFCRTLVCNLDMAARRPSETLIIAFLAFMRYLNDFLAASDTSNIPQAVSDNGYQGVPFEQLSIGRAAAGRRFCSTKNGHLGMIPAMAREEDLICLFIGGLTPFVIRPKTDGVYQLIGECYVHCMMNGEVLELPDFNERLEDIVLG